VFRTQQLFNLTRDGVLRTSPPLLSRYFVGLQSVYLRFRINKPEVDSLRQYAKKQKGHLLPAILVVVVIG
jgi:hypothetical protein